ncbi:4'-phosphopantetheinyl transferase family protein [Pseudalkalibacillus sp. SCS-8]|uniref:4'-phosphopantetheinyl transferase family protein n=1 Tax=Pseudalkalibacillus nanhaiensis TaxID=3115291 RepID=UPI0032DAC8E0
MTPGVYAVKIPNKLEEKQFSALLSFVDKDKNKRINKFMNRKDKIRSLIGDTLIRCLISKHLNIPNKAINFEVNEYGKPSLKAWNQFHFNISHSGDWVVAAIDNKPIGIDVETMGSIEYIEIAKSFFSQKEYQWLLSQDDKRRKKCFYKLWTSKESYIKLMGKGLSIPLESFSVLFEGDDLYVNIDNDLDMKKNHRLRVFSIDSDHLLAVCSNKDLSQIKVVFKDYKELFSCLGS